jgi:hypothetical protein
VRRLLKFGQIMAHSTIRKPALDRKLDALRLNTGPALVVGSAPDATLPRDFDGTWSIVTVNASQGRLDGWGVERPTLTVLRNRIMEDEPHQIAVWTQLRGRSTDHLIMLASSRNEVSLREGVSARGYDAGYISLLSDEQKGAVIHQLTGLIGVSCDLDRGVSQGVFAALLALRVGAPAVVVTGVSFSSTDHFYDKWSQRAHIDGDRQVFHRVAKRGLPIYAADDRLAEESGLPRWQV